MDVKSILPNQREGKRTDGTLLKACIDMYHATGEIQYHDAVLEYLDSYVPSDGKLMIADSKDGLIHIVPYGKALFFAWDETGEERYRKAAQQFMEQLSALEQLPNLKIAASQNTMFLFQSFVIEYDNRFGNKQRYKEVVNCFQTLRSQYYNDEKNLYNVVLNDSENRRNNLVNHCRVLIQLVDTIEEMDMMLYEHYRTLSDLFLEAVRGILLYRVHEIGLLTDSVIDSDDLVTMDGNLMTAYVLFKGVRLGLLDDEKYLPVATEMVSAMCNTCAADLMDDDFSGSLCYRMMAKAEMIEVNKK